MDALGMDAPELKAAGRHDLAGDSSAHVHDHDHARDPSDRRSKRFDCEHCALLNALTALLLFTVLAFLQPAARLVATFPPLPRRMRGHPTGLGSRGPPRPA